MARWFKYKIRPQLLTLLLVLTGLSCDPGYYYVPKDWTRTDGKHFSKNFDSFDITISDLGGLVGTTYLMPEVIIENRTKSPFVLTDGLLKANGRVYTAKWTEQNYKNGWDPIPGGEKRNLELSFDLNKPVNEVLKGEVELVLSVRVENEVKEINIPFVEESR
jgi:hypothetical protein